MALNRKVLWNKNYIGYLILRKLVDGVLKLALTFAIIAIALYIINRIYEITILITIAKICLIITVVCVVIKIIAKIFGVGD